jgi:hypothetical protein
MNLEKETDDNDDDDDDNEAAAVATATATATAAAEEQIVEQTSILLRETAISTSNNDTNTTSSTGDGSMVETMVETIESSQVAVEGGSNIVSTAGLERIMLPVALSSSSKTLVEGNTNLMAMTTAKRHTFWDTQVRKLTKWDYYFGMRGMCLVKNREQKGTSHASVCDVQ